jgi:hypothetical protein
MRGWRNMDYSEQTITAMLDAIFNNSTNISENNEIKNSNIKIKYHSGTLADKKTHYIINDGNANFYIKIFNSINPVMLVRDVFRSTKSMKFYVMSGEIRNRGGLIPAPVFFLEKRFLFFKFQSIIATREIEDSTLFRDHYENWTAENPEYRSIYLTRLAEFIYFLNSREIGHADLVGNILIQEKTNESGKGKDIDIYLIDHDAVKSLKNLTRFDYIKHFEGFYDFFVKNRKVSEEDWNTLCLEYLKLDNRFFNSIDDITDQVKHRKNLTHYIKTK